ncbi:MAG TPA: hypothetical protein VIL30_16815 [Ramlibacter sp.]
MNNVIDLAAVRAARNASTCTFDIYGDLRRPELTDIVSVGISCDFCTGVELFEMVAARRRQADSEFELPATVIEQEPDGAYWVEGYMTFAQAQALQDELRARGIGRKAS